MAVPEQVVALAGDLAQVRAGARTRQVSLMMLDEPVAVGDYLRIQHGHFAVERLEPEVALQTLALLDELLAVEQALQAADPATSAAR